MYVPMSTMQTDLCVYNTSMRVSDTDVFVFDTDGGIFDGGCLALLLLCDSQA